MAAKVKKMFRSYADAEQAYSRANHQRTCLSICLQTLATEPQSIRWLERGNYRVGLIRPDSPTGGYALLIWYPDNPGQKPSTSAHYVDDLSRDYLRNGFEPSDKDQHDLRNLIVYLEIERNKLAGY